MSCLGREGSDSSLHVSSYSDTRVLSRWYQGIFINVTPFEGRETSDLLPRRCMESQALVMLVSVCNEDWSPGTRGAGIIYIFFQGGESAGTRRKETYQSYSTMKFA